MAIDPKEAKRQKVASLSDAKLEEIIRKHAERVVTAFVAGSKGAAKKRREAKQETYLRQAVAFFLPKARAMRDRLIAQGYGGAKPNNATVHHLTEAVVEQIIRDSYPAFRRWYDANRRDH